MHSRLAHPPHGKCYSILVFMLSLWLVGCSTGDSEDSANILSDPAPPPSVPPGGGTDTTPPTVSINVPTNTGTFPAKTNSVDLGGTASDNVGVTQVTWVNDRGGNGSASGTNNWTANGIPLQKGSNVITVTARDAAGKFNKDVLTVDYTPGSTATNVTLTLAWDPNPAADTVQGYFVYSGPSANSTPTRLSDLPVSSLFDPNAPSMQYNAGTNLGLITGDPVCFRLKAYNSAGLSGYSVAACTTI